LRGYDKVRIVWLQLRLSRIESPFTNMISQNVLKFGCVFFFSFGLVIIVRDRCA